MKVLVIEFEKGVVKKITEMLNDIDDSIEVIGITDGLHSAAHWLTHNKVPDLILANEGIINGIGADTKREIKTVVKFSTDTAEFHFAAFRYKTIRQLLADAAIADKPMRFEPYWSQPEKTTPGAHKERFLVKQGQRLLSIPVSQIAYFFSQERFIFFRTFDNQKFLLEYRIEQLENLLAPDLFFRINRSYIISMRTVKEIHAYFGNRLKLYLQPDADKEVIVSRKRVAEFKHWLGK